MIDKLQLYKGMRLFFLMAALIFCKLSLAQNNNNECAKSATLVYDFAKKKHYMLAQRLSKQENDSIECIIKTTNLLVPLNHGFNVKIINIDPNFFMASTTLRDFLYSNYELVDNVKTVGPIKNIEDSFSAQSNNPISCAQIAKNVKTISAKITRFENTLVMLYSILKIKNKESSVYRKKLAELLGGTESFFTEDNYSVSETEMLSYGFQLNEIKGFRESLGSIENIVEPTELDSCLVASSLKSKYQEIRTFYDESLASELKLFFDLANLIFNKNSGTIELPSEDLEFNYGYTEVEINIAPRSDNLNEINNLLKKKNLPTLKDDQYDLINLKLPVFKRGGFKIQPSVGFIFNSISKNKSYGIAKDSLLIGEKNGISPMIGAQINAQTYLAKGFQLGIAFGTAIPLKEDDLVGASFYFGPAFTFGKIDNLILSAGISLGRVKGFTNGYKVGDKIEEGFDLDSNLRNKYETGFFFGLSYNIFQRKPVNTPK